MPARDRGSSQGQDTEEHIAQESTRHRRRDNRRKDRTDAEQRQARRKIRKGWSVPRDGFSASCRGGQGSYSLPGRKAQHSPGPGRRPAWTKGESWLLHKVRGRCHHLAFRTPSGAGPARGLQSRLQVLVQGNAAHHSGQVYSSAPFRARRSRSARGHTCAPCHLPLCCQRRGL